MGSKRRGANWYAASSTCTSGSSPKPCNIDGYQLTGDWARNAGCGKY